MGPLEGVRVLDFTRFQQGPFATAMLSDLGAEVIKVEERDGEMGRRTEALPDGFSPYFEAYNRGKRSVTLDLKQPAAQEIVRRCLREVDVLVENFRPGVMDRLGLGYDAVHQEFPRLIYASASAFGSRGPLARRPGFDHIAQAMSGLMVEQAGGRERDPVPGLPGLSDQVSALFLALGIVSALWARERTGEGQHVEVSLLGSMAALQARQITRYLWSGILGRKKWRRSPLTTHYQAKEGWVAIQAMSQNFWPGVCRALDLPELADDPRFSGPWERDANADELEAMLEARFAERPAAEWLERLVTNDVPCSLVSDYHDLAENPQMEANGYLTTVEHPLRGTLRTTGVPIHLSGTPPGPVRPSPALGQHTEETLLSLGYTWDDIEALKRDEVI